MVFQKYHTWPCCGISITVNMMLHEQLHQNSKKQVCNVWSTLALQTQPVCMSKSPHQIIWYCPSLIGLLASVDVKQQSRIIWNPNCNVYHLHSRQSLLLSPLWDMFCVVSLAVLSCIAFILLFSTLEHGRCALVGSDSKCYYFPLLDSTDEFYAPVCFWLLWWKAEKWLIAPQTSCIILGHNYPSPKSGIHVVSVLVVSLFPFFF